MSGKQRDTRGTGGVKEGVVQEETVMEIGKRTLRKETRGDQPRSGGKKTR